MIVPGWADTDEDPPAALVDAVRASHEAGARVVSLCTGAFVPAAAGLLDGRRATTHWAHTGTLAARRPRVGVDSDVRTTTRSRRCCPGRSNASTSRSPWRTWHAGRA